MDIKMCTAFMVMCAMLVFVVAQPASAAAAAGKAATQPQPQPSEMKIPTVGSNGKPQDLRDMLAEGWAQEKMRSCKKIVPLHMAELHVAHPINTSLHDLPAELTTGIRKENTQKLDAATAADGGGRMIKAKLVSEPQKNKKATKVDVTMTLEHCDKEGQWCQSFAVARYSLNRFRWVAVCFCVCGHRPTERERERDTHTHTHTHTYTHTIT